MISAIGADLTRDDARVNRLRLVHRVAQSHLQSPKGGHRQADVLALASIGLSDREIAAKLGMSPQTVATYWRRLFGTLGTSSRTEAVAILLVMEIDQMRMTEKVDVEIPDEPLFANPRYNSIASSKQRVRQR